MGVPSDVANQHGDLDQIRPTLADGQAVEGGSTDGGSEVRPVQLLHAHRRTPHPT